MDNSKKRIVNFKLDPIALHKMDQHLAEKGFTNRSEYILALVQRDMSDESELPQTTNRLLLELHHQMIGLGNQFNDAFGLNFKSGMAPSKYEKLKFAIMHFASFSIRKNKQDYDEFKSIWMELFKSDEQI